MSDKVEIRLKVPKWISDALKEYCEKFGATPVSTITPLLVEFLWHPSRAHHISFRNINIINTVNSTKSGNVDSKPRKKKGTQIPDDFSPPRSITEKEGLNYDIAVEMFVDWAKGKGHVQANWDSTFRNACRTWIKEKMPRNEPNIKIM